MKYVSIISSMRILNVRTVCGYKVPIISPTGCVFYTSNVHMQKFDIRLALFVRIEPCLLPHARVARLALGIEGQINLGISNYFKMNFSI